MKYLLDKEGYDLIVNAANQPTVIGGSDVRPPAMAIKDFAKELLKHIEEVKS